MAAETLELIGIIRAMLSDPELGAGLAAPDAGRRHQALEALRVGKLSASEVRRVLVAMRGGRPDAASERGRGA